MPVAGGDQVRQERLGAVNHAPIVHIHHPLDVLELGDLDIAAERDSGVVVDLIDLAEVLLDVVGVEQEGLPLRHIQAIRFDRCTDGFEATLGDRQPLGVDIADGHRGSVPSQLDRQFGTHAGPRSGNHCHFAGKSLHAYSLLTGVELVQSSKRILPPVTSADRPTIHPS